MNCRIFFLLSFFLVFPIVFSVEMPISVLGFEDQVITEFHSFKCFSATFSDEVFSNVNGLHPILSVNANFVGKEFDSSFISVEFNGNRQILWKENFVCKDKCVARVFLDEIKSSNNIEFCIRTGLSEVSFFSDSKIGFYDTPVLKINNISPARIVLGERAKMLIDIKNTGSKEASVFVQFVAEDLRSLIKITSFDIVEGDASASTIIKPNETKQFVFYIKPVIVANYNLPSSELHFTNIFGENQKILSNHPPLEVVEPNQADITLIGNEIIDDQFNFSVKVKNNWGETLNGKISIFPADMIVSDKEVILNAFAEKTFDFKTEKLAPGEYFLQAQIFTADFNYVSDSIFFTVMEKNYFFEILFSIIAIIVTLGIFATIYFEKN